MEIDQGKLLGISKAAKVLGVHPLTLRNWAEKGHIPFYRTPGGHRRFRERDLRDFLTEMNQVSPESALVSVARHAVQQAIATFPQHQPVEIHRPVWQMSLTEEQRKAMRSVGRRLLGLTIQYASGAADGAVLGQAREIGRTYGKFAKHHGLSIGETVATFNFFRETIIEATFYTPPDAVHIDTSHPQLYQRLNHFFNEVLLSTVQAAEGSVSEMIDNGQT